MENLLAREKIYWPGNNEVYFHLTVCFISANNKHQAGSGNKNQIISRLSKFGEKCHILSKFFTGQAGPVSKKNYWPETIFTGHGPAGQC